MKHRIPIIAQRYQFFRGDSPNPNPSLSYILLAICVIFSGIANFRLRIGFRLLFEVPTIIFSIYFISKQKFGAYKVLSSGYLSDMVIGPLNNTVLLFSITFLLVTFIRRKIK